MSIIVSPFNQENSGEKWRFYERYFQNNDIVFANRSPMCYSSFRRLQQRAKLSLLRLWNGMRGSPDCNNSL